MRLDKTLRWLLLQRLAELAAANDKWNNFIHWARHENEIVPGFDRHDPFPVEGSVSPTPFTLHCQSTATFHATQYKASEFWVHPPKGLRPYAQAIEDFIKHRRYPGHWDGVDHGGHGGAAREWMVMEYKDVPIHVRNWIEEHQRHGRDDHDKWLYAVFKKAQGDQKITTTVKPPPAPATTSAPTEESRSRDISVENKILFFAAGALYEILPLWVAHAGKCEAAFTDLSRYKVRAEDDAVIAWPIYHTYPDDKHGHKGVEFVIRAMDVTETPEMKHARTSWERVLRTAKRHERRREKEARGQTDPDDEPDPDEPDHDEL